MAKTNIGLVEYCRAQLGKPYWYGTFGQTATAKLYAEKRSQYPKYYSMADYPLQYGKRVHDCIGLIKGYLWSNSPTSPPIYNGKQDIGANAMLSLCSERGRINTMPDIPGVLVFMDNHVGVYVGDGKVIEARGHSYGVVETKLSARLWQYWGKCPFIEYGEEGNKVLVEYTTLTYGDTGNQVRTVQRLLKALDCVGANGKPLIVDGVIGDNTSAAIKRFQTKTSLKADGIVGRLTWAALTGGEPK